MKLRFDTKGNDKQFAACQAWADPEVFEIYYGGAKYGGKSYLGCSLIFSDALTYPETHYFIARKELSDLTKHTIPSINEVFQHWGLSNNYYTYNGKDNIYHLYNKSRVYLLYAKYLPSDPMYERFGSMQMTRGWMEEGGEFVEDAYKNLKISIGRWKNEKYNLEPKLLTTFNPKKNYIYRNVYKPFKAGTLSKDVAYISALIHDNKTASPAYIKNLEDTLTGAARQRLLLGNMEYDDDDNFLLESYDKILDVFTIDYLEPGKKYIICDAARFGSDRAIIGVFDELKLIDYKIYDKSKTTEISGKIKAFQKIHKVPNSRTLVDSDGVGGGVVDEVGCIGFVNNLTPIKEIDNVQIKDLPNYDNLKSQCGFKLAEVINGGLLAVLIDLLPDSEKDKIIEEFEQLKRNEDDRKLGLISKEDMKDNVGRSPDWLDLFIMRMYFEIKEPDSFMFNQKDLRRFELNGTTFKEEVFVIIRPAKDAKKNYTVIVGKKMDKSIYITDVIYTKKDSRYTELSTLQLISESKPTNIIIDTSKDLSLKRKIQKEYKNIRVRGIHQKMNTGVSIKSKFKFIKESLVFRTNYHKSSDYDLFMKDMLSLLSDASNKEVDDAPGILPMLAKQAEKAFPELYN